MKQRVIIIGLITLILCIVLFVSAQIINKTTVKGDVNGDGAVNIVDAILIVNIILYPEPPASEEEICAADCNGDGFVNIMDVLLIVNVILDSENFHFASSCDELDCDDRNTCTQDSCDSLCIQCIHTDLSSGTPCDDEDLCTEDDQCIDGICQGTPKNCDDSDPCTDDSCDPDVGCIYIEVCCDNGIDDDGDGNSDCADGDCQVDNDGDGHYVAPCGNDWDDDDPDVYPGAPEICDDDKDNDQDGNIDCRDSDCLGDSDGDGYRIKPCGDDCNDSDADVNPGLAEVCDDGKDNDCDGSTDCGPDCFVTDIDGNTYPTVQIGDQCWMAENLKVTRYRHGSAIPNVTDDSDWINLTSGAYCNYDNDIDNVATYGRLYNWYAVDDSRGIAPEGWHVPSDEEWKQLEMHLGMSQSEADDTGWRGTDEGGKLKATGTIEGGDGLWYSPNTGATNESGFSAVSAAYRVTNGQFANMGLVTGFWSSSEYNIDEAWVRALNTGSQIGRYNDSLKEWGLSVRCVKDQTLS